MNETERRETIVIDVKRLLLIIWQRLWLILLSGVILASLAFGYAWMFVTPTYEASTQIYVNNQMNTDALGFSSSQITAAQELAYTYMVILQSRNVLDDVAKKTDLGYSYGELKSMIKASTVNSTEVFQVVVKCPDYKHAARIANAIADVLPAKIAAVVDGSSVRVVDYAVENPNQVSPNYQLYIIVGFLAGFVLCTLILVLLDVLDTTINSEDFLTRFYNEFPLLAVIPSTEESGSRHSKYYGYYVGNYETVEKKPPQRTPQKQNGGAK